MMLVDYCGTCKYRDVLWSGEPCSSISKLGITAYSELQEAPACYNPRNEVEVSDNVNHPNHYTFGSIEVIDYIRDKMTPVEFQGYCQGNVLKYVSRYRHKGGVEDLKKAQVYLDWMIESLEKEAEGK